MKTTNWDALVTSAPIDKDAALARDGKGESWSPVTKITNCLDHPGELKAFHDPTSCAEDLTGQRFGGVVVLGVSVRDTSKGKTAWVARCDCGKYARFSRQGIHAARVDGRAYCGECLLLHDIQAGKGKTPLQRKQRAETHQERKARDAARDALVHPRFEALVQEIEASGAMDRATAIKSLGSYIQIALGNPPNVRSA